MSRESRASDSDLSATASALHRFNRYEIKYLIHESKIERLRRGVRSHMAVDSHHRTGGAMVTTLYYDTRDLRFYWEKIEGLRFRRKLRIRAYGEPETIDDSSTTFVEIKQRVNRVTQKRRIPLSYADARMLCDQRIDPGDPDVRPAFVNEVLTLAQALDLQPTAITMYHREALVGADADLGLRITMDHRLRGRDRDFYLGARTTNRMIVPPHVSVVEVKANERVPSWFTDLAAQLSLSTARISKYCETIEAHGLGVRATQHVRQFPKPAVAAGS